MCSSSGRRVTGDARRSSRYLWTCCRCCARDLALDGIFSDGLSILPAGTSSISFAMPSIQTAVYITIRPARGDAAAAPENSGTARAAQILPPAWAPPYGGRADDALNLLSHFLAYSITTTAMRLPGANTGRAAASAYWARARACARAFLGAGRSAPR